MTYCIRFWRLIFYLPPLKTSAGMFILRSVALFKRDIKIYYLMELENNDIITNWCPDTTLLCCLTTLSQHSGGNESISWSCTTRQTTQCEIRMSLCSYFSALSDSVEWKYLLSPPRGSTAAKRAVSPSYSNSLRF